MRSTTTAGSGGQGRGPVAALLAVALLTLAGCQDGGTTATGPSGPASSTGRWSDVDTTVPSEDPVATVYGYVQAMAAGDRAAACAFHYRGSSDHDDSPCLLEDEQPRRDRRLTADDWAALAAYRLGDYAAADAGRVWRVSLPTTPVTGWRIRQDDAGIWFIA